MWANATRTWVRLRVANRAYAPVGGTQVSTAKPFQNCEVRFGHGGRYWCMQRNPIRAGVTILTFVL